MKLDDLFLIGKTMTYLRPLLDVSALLFGSLLGGSMFGLWLVLNPKGLDASTYIIMQQQAIRRLNTAMPVLGLITVVTCVVAAMLAPLGSPKAWTLYAASVAFLGAGVVTRFFNQPINARMQRWASSAPPVDWARLRDVWWRWHIVRLLSGLAGLALLLGETVAHSH
jgi:uncharacterized membrane protein